MAQGSVSTGVGDRLGTPPGAAGLQLLIEYEYHPNTCDCEAAGAGGTQEHNVPYDSCNVFKDAVLEPRSYGMSLTGPQHRHNTHHITHPAFSGLCLPDVLVSRVALWIQRPICRQQELVYVLR